MIYLSRIKPKADFGIVVDVVVAVVSVSLLLRHIINRSNCHLKTALLLPLTQNVLLKTDYRSTKDSKNNNNSNKQTN